MAQIVALKLANIAFVLHILAMQVVDYLPVLLQLISALVIAVVILGASHIFGQRAKENAIKDSPYECGVLFSGASHPRFSVKFYLTAMLFIIFDIEVVFMIPWVMIYREFLKIGIPILMPMFVFLGVLVIGLVYELKKGALEWEK